MRLQRYDLDVRYKKGSELHLADTLSRHYPKLTEATQDQREHVLFARSAFEEGLEVKQDVQEINHLLVSEHEAEMFREETKNDEVVGDEDIAGPSARHQPAFKGAGYRLGDTEDESSQPLPETISNRQSNSQQQTKEVVLKFWSNGFSVDDGPLRSF